MKAAHVTFVIFWMAGLFLLPRFYVYHQETTAGSPEDRAWIEREDARPDDHPHPGDDRRLGARADARRSSSMRWSQGWFHAKLALVIALTGYQGWLGAYGKKLAHGQRPLSGKALRMMNEIPGIAAALIVVLVIVRPF